MRRLGSSHPPRAPLSSSCPAFVAPWSADNLEFQPLGGKKDVSRLQAAGSGVERALKMGEGTSLRGKQREHRRGRNLSLSFPLALFLAALSRCDINFSSAVASSSALSTGERSDGLNGLASAWKGGPRCSHPCFPEWFYLSFFFRSFPFFLDSSPSTALPLLSSLQPQHRHGRIELQPQTQN